MKTTGSIDELRRQISEWRREGERVGLVPTMGNLHAGHLELVRHASSRTQHVVVSIFVNPMQFCSGEDFDSYPRTLRRDQEKLEHEQVDVLFMPCVETIYPRGVEASTRIEVPQVSEGMCGDFRPGHFTGVATVVACLFNLVQPQLAVFGEKDYQQLAVIRRMVGDLCWDIEIEGVPTVREADGLAMSSRNQYLTETERKRAPALYRTLCQVAERLRAQERSYRDLEMTAMADLEKAGFSPEYVNIRQAETLLPAEIGETRCVVLAAARLGDTRLIDNVKV